MERPLFSARISKDLGDQQYPVLTWNLSRGHSYALPLGLQINAVLLDSNLVIATKAFEKSISSDEQSHFKEPFWGNN